MRNPVIDLNFTVGSFVNHGETILQVKSPFDDLLMFLDSTGAVHTPMIEFADGSQQTSAGVALPSAIDAGVF